MAVAITEEKLNAARTYLKDTADRFAGLLETTSRSQMPATVHWTVADTAAHVVALARLCAWKLESDGRDAPPIAGISELMQRTVVDTVDRMNEEVLSQFGERRLPVLAAMLRAEIDNVIRASDAADPARGMPWLGESIVPLAGVIAHMLNELQIHGRDIARAVRAPWKVPPQEAAPFFDLFLVGVTRYGYGKLLEGHGPARPGRVAVEFRSPYTTTVTMAMTDGFVEIEEPGGPVDVRLRFDPTTLNLMLFGRISKPRALLTGKVSVGGRRPWLLPAFLKIVRLPS